MLSADLAASAVPREDPALLDVGGMLARHASERADRPFVRVIGSGEEIDFQTTERVSAGAVERMRRMGVSAGDRVALLAENSIECVLVYLACLRAGFVVAPLNAEINNATVSSIVDDLQPRLVVANATQRTLAQSLAAGVEVPALVASFSSLRDPGAGDLFHDLPSPRNVDLPRVDPHRPALVTYTSGTTDKPKGVVHSLSSYAHLAAQTLDLTGIGPDDRILESRSLSWISAQVISIGSAVYSGACAVLAPRFSRRNFFRWISDEAITVAVGVPTAINMLLEEKVDLEGERFPSLRYLTSSSAPLSPHRHRDFEVHYGIRIMQYYGMSEAGFMAGNREDRAVLTTVGQVTRYQDLRIVDSGTGSVCPPGVEGEILVGGPQMALGYYEKGGLAPLPDRTSFRTGDLGVLDEHGYLRITGRSKDIVIRGGVNIAPLEITTAVLAHPDVLDAGTIGVPDPVYGEELVTFVATRGPRVDAAVREFLESRLSPFKVPKHIRFLDAIPKTERGKTDVSALRGMWDSEATATAEGRPAEGAPA
ncbi:class I adenylate-forming enzyme family protein [Actinophytocola sp.]|uniref:class I adenylate-forming enzyme family protein n=1 Tax=Actinophytocola sp. TaxID=1872138 RepID=UPI003D6A9985